MCLNRIAYSIKGIMHGFGLLGKGKALGDSQSIEWTGRSTLAQEDTRLNDVVDYQLENGKEARCLIINLMKICGESCLLIMFEHEKSNCEALSLPLFSPLLLIDKLLLIGQYHSSALLRHAPIRIHCTISLNSCKYHHN